MKLQINKSIVLALLMVMPIFSFANSVFTPQKMNYGTYKPDIRVNRLLKPLFGHVPSDVENASDAGLVEGNMVLDVSIVLPLNNEPELDRLLMEITDPASPFYQHYLSAAEYKERFAPSDAQVEATIEYLLAHGMHVSGTDNNRLIIHATGTVATLNEIFFTELHYFSDDKGQTFFAPMYEPQVEQNLSIHSVHGLENRIRAFPKYRVLEGSENNECTLNAPSRGLTPGAIKKAYNLSSTLNGQGQTLALFELDGFNQSDITAYENAFNLPHVPLETILVDGFDGSAGDGAAEVVLDIELMIALAPGVSKILVYEGPNTGKGLLDTYNKIASENRAASISSSWGLSELSSTNSLLSAENLIFKQMAAQGQSLYAASGDNGAYDNGTKLSVDDPASQPFVVGVGGTTLSINSDQSYKSETTWSSGNGPNNSGGGGGISAVWSIPDWQKGVVSGATKGSTTMRNVPDVALDADPKSGYAIYFNGGWQVYGGTSCAAPLWAAFTALVNQQRVQNGQNTLGFPSPALYKIGTGSTYTANFHDIKDQSTNGYYPAVSSYDLATGWGTFYGDQLLSSLSGSSVTPPPPPPSCVTNNPAVSISPSSQSAVAGTVLTYMISLTNNDTTNCADSNFTLQAVVPQGLSAQLKSTTLNLKPGASANVSVSVTSGTSLAAGNYQFSVTATHDASSLTGTANANYVVTSPSNSGYSISVTPKNASFTSGSTAHFQFFLSNNSVGLSGQAFTIVLIGAQKPFISAKSDTNGLYQLDLPLDSSFAKGNHEILCYYFSGVKLVLDQTSFTVK